MSLIKNASPGVIHLGTDDKSGRVVTPERDPIPQHCPKVYIKARKGSTKPMLLGAAKFIPSYGVETFDRDLGYYNHQTRFLEAIGGTGNACMVQRLVADDAGVRSNITLYVDVLRTDIPNYVRNSTGDYAIDPDTNAFKIDAITPTIQGLKIKFITEYNTGTVDRQLGTLATKQGTMEANGVKSTMYPLMEFMAKYQGEYYNNIGFTIESLYGEDVSDRITDEAKVIPYKLALYSRTNAGATPTIFRSLYGEPSVICALKEKVKNPLTEARFDIDAVFAQQWFNETDVLKSLRYNDYEGLYVYRNNLEIVLTDIMTLERAYISDTDVMYDDGKMATSASWFDYTTADQDKLLEEKYLIELFNCKSSKSKPYFTVVRDNSTPVLTGTQKEISISKYSPIFLNGGSDGSLSNEMYESVLVRELAKYADPDSEVMDTAINVESTIYDSGFRLETKKSLIDFIAYRKDTNVVLSTHDDSLGEKDVSLSDIRAIAVALKTRAKLAPESEYYGTPVMRCVVMGGTGLMRDGSTLNRIPLTYELALKTAKMMGAGDYKWKSNFKFDHGDAAILDELVDVSPSFIPAGIKPTLWADGVVWAQPKDRVQYFFPAVQTVYDDDTSVLNSWPNVFAVGTLVKIADDCWREFSGATFMTDSEFTLAVTTYMEKRLAGIFADLVTVIPEVVIDEADAQRGYSWHLINKLYAANAKTKMVYTTQAYRSSDL